MSASKIADDKIAKAAQRLIAEESEEVREARAAGVEEGRNWALEWAQPSELRRMEALVQDWQSHVEDRMSAYAGESVPDYEDAPFESIRQWFAEGNQLDYVGEALAEYWGAFENAALETYEKVQQAMEHQTPSATAQEKLEQLRPVGTKLSVGIFRSAIFNGCENAFGRANRGGDISQALRSVLELATAEAKKVDPNFEVEVPNGWFG